MTRAEARRAAALLLCAALAAGCGTRATDRVLPASDVRSVDLRPTPGTPGPQAQYGLSMTIALDRPSAQVGEVVTGVVVIRNEGKTPAKVGSSCVEGAPVLIEVTQGMGLVPAMALAGPLAAFRDRALKARLQAAEPDAGCAAGQQPRMVELPPGHSTSGTIAWPVQTVNGSSYDGGVVVRAQAYWQVGPDDAAVFGVMSSPEAALRVSGGDASRVSPSRALDLALADPDFAAQVSAGVTAEPAGDLVSFRPRDAAYEIAVTHEGSGGSGSGADVRVDAATGAVGPVGGFGSTY